MLSILKSVWVILEKLIPPLVAHTGLLIQRERFTRRVGAITLRALARKLPEGSAGAQVFLAAAEELEPPEHKCKVSAGSSET